MRTKFTLILLVCILVGCAKNADIESVNIPSDPVTQTVLPKISKDISVLSADDAIKVANLFSHGKVLTKSETLKDVRNVVPIKDASDRTLMYAVNYDDGYAIVSATKNYHPVLAVVDHGTYTGEKTGTGQDVLMNEYMVATEAAMDGEISVDKSVWSEYEEVPFEIPAQTKVSDEYNDVLNHYLEDWYMAGYNIYMLRDQPENLPDDVYEQFCDFARDYDRPDHDYMQCSFIVENVISDYDVIGPLCQTTWDQVFPYNESLENTQQNLGCSTIAAAQIMKSLEYPSSIPWDSMPNSLSLTQVADTLTEFLAELRDNLGVTNNGSGTIHKVKKGLEDNYNYNSDYGVSLSIIDHNTSPIIASLDTDVPVYMRGIEPGSIFGHAWVCDGYYSSHNQTDYYLYVIPLGVSEITELTRIDTHVIYGNSVFMFHHNWGWGGSDNGYYMDYNVTTSNGTYSNLRKELIIEFDRL